MVYPRPRGEAFRIRHLGGLEHGLSPPTRGSHFDGHHRLAGCGSIPAHAGKPSNSVRSMCSVAVYPRPRGEACGGRSRSGRWGGGWCGGLSPPTRGSPRRRARASSSARSIPAHAGKPPTCRGVGRAPRVYPRPRGEAKSRVSSRSFPVGLSPPTRGSRWSTRCTVSPSRSIPAHAGKPAQVATRSHLRWVYPRPRGEAGSVRVQPVPSGGLSPPTRGSPRRRGQKVPEVGSIPAHAGKPTRRSRSSCPTWVYPRPRGEAAVDHRHARHEGGLSPPTRGSRAVGALPRL